MSITRRTFLAVGSATVAATLGSLGRSSSSLAQNRSSVVNLYSARHYDTDNAVYESFTKKTGIKVRLIEAEADALIERIKSEGNNSPADLLVTVDAGRLWRAQDAGILQPVTSSVLKSAIPENLREPQGFWFGLTKRARVIVYNTDKVRPSELSTYEDLTSPKWKGRIVVRSSTNIYNQSLIGSVLAAYGPEKTETWVRGLVANFARPPQGNDTAQIKAVAVGEADLAVVNHYYLLRLATSKKIEDRRLAAKVKAFFPNQQDRGTHINISGAGVVKTAPNRAAAIQFLEHLVSAEAQAIFAKGNYEFPVRSGISLDPAVSALGRFKEDKLNAAVFGRNNPEALKIADRGGWK